jgi:hypothetical protein
MPLEFPFHCILAIQLISYKEEIKDVSGFFS